LFHRGTDFYYDDYFSVASALHVVTFANDDDVANDDDDDDGVDDDDAGLFLDPE